MDQWTENTVVEIISNWIQKIIKRSEDGLRNLSNNIKHTNIHFIEISEGEETEEGSEIIFEDIIVESFPNLGKKIDMQDQEVQRVPNKINLMLVLFLLYSKQTQIYIYIYIYIYYISIMAYHRILNIV